MLGSAASAQPAIFLDRCRTPAASQARHFNASAAMPTSPAKPRGLAERGASCLAWNLRLFSILQLAAGVGYIVLAVFLQFPPGDPLTL